MSIISPSKTTVHGVALEVLRIPGTADRPTLVFLHEGLGSVALWRDWPERLCQRLGSPGLVYSRQGYGQSDPRPEVRGTGRLQPDYMHREALQVLPELLRLQGIEHPVLVGHSDGGTIGLLHAAHHPVSACIVMAPHVMVEEVSVRSIEAAREAYENGPLRSRLAPFHADVDCAFWQWNEVWLSAAFRSYDIRQEISAIRAPLLAIQGEDDPYGTLAQIDDIAAAVPHAQRVKLPQCGHSPHRDQPEAVAQAIGDFLVSRARTA
jgi:pimeloyl-ACP methyl ester carboxylesterase